MSAGVYSGGTDCVTALLTKRGDVVALDDALDVVAGLPFIWAAIWFHACMRVAGSIS